MRSNDRNGCARTPSVDSCEITVESLFNFKFETTKAFEPPPGGRFTADSSNHLLAPVAGKDTTELWNWYKAHASAGGSGDAGFVGMVIPL